MDVRLSNHNVTYRKELKEFVDKSEGLYKEITRGSKRFQAHKVDEVNELYELGRDAASQGTALLSCTRTGGSLSRQ